MKFLIDLSDSDSYSDFELPRRPSFVARGLSSLRRSCRRVTRSMAKISFTKAGFQSFLRLELAFISKNRLRLLLNGTKLIQWTQFLATETISFNKMNSLKPSTLLGLFLRHSGQTICYRRRCTFVIFYLRRRVICRGWMSSPDSQGGVHSCKVKLLNIQSF